MRIYARLRPGNPPQLEKATTLFFEKFYDENRYRLGRVGRFRINRKFDQNVPETEMTLRAEDLINSLKYMFKLRSGRGVRRRHRPPGQPPAADDRRAGGGGDAQGVPQAQADRPGADVAQGPERAGADRRAGQQQVDQQQHRLLLRPGRAVAGRRPDEPAESS